MKNNTKHTPGPWFAIEFAGFYDLKKDEYYESESLLNVEESLNASKNAQLAAAAPELLEALKYARRFLTDSQHYDVEYLDSIIKKATGNEK